MPLEYYIVAINRDTGGRNIPETARFIAAAVTQAIDSQGSHKALAPQTIRCRKAIDGRDHISNYHLVQPPRKAT